MRRLTVFWRWEVLVVVLAGATLGLALVGHATALRTAVVLAFLAFCPGLCVLRVLGLRFSLPTDLAYSVAVSLVVVGVVGGVTLYAGAWSPERLTNYLAAAAIVFTSLAATVGRGPERRRSGEG
jgi:uncharacterized membrane protein